MVAAKLINESHPSNGSDNTRSSRLKVKSATLMRKKKSFGFAVCLVPLLVLIPGTRSLLCGLCMFSLCVCCYFSSPFMTCSFSCWDQHGRPPLCLSCSLWIKHVAAGWPAGTPSNASHPDGSSDLRQSRSSRLICVSVWLWSCLRDWNSTCIYASSPCACTKCFHQLC